MHISVKSFDFYFFIFWLSNVLPVNTKSLFKLPSGLSNIFLIATAADNYIYKVGSFATEIRFQNKWLVPILEFKGVHPLFFHKHFPHFVVLKIALFDERYEEHKSLFKLDGCLLKSINLCSANILPKWLYVLIMSRTRFRVNPHSIVAWISRNSLLETGAKSEVLSDCNGTRTHNHIFPHISLTFETRLDY